MNALLNEGTKLRLLRVDSYPSTALFEGSGILNRLLNLSSNTNSSSNSNNQFANRKFYSAIQKIIFEPYKAGKNESGRRPVGTGRRG
jgi:hypothetical protein